MKYLYGRVTVNIAVVDAKDDKEAIELFGYPEETPLKEKATYWVAWRENPGDDPIKERDKVLAGFLELMTKIPFNPDAKFSPIITPPGSLTVVEETKIEDHENAGGN